MLDGSDEGEVNALAITKYHLFYIILERESISSQEVKIKKSSCGDMMKVYATTLEQDTLVQLQEYNDFYKLR